MNLEELTALKNELYNHINDLLLKKEYEQAGQLVNQIVFSEDKFVFENIIDEKLRYIQILLEIVQCEKQRGMEPNTLKKYMTIEKFIEIYTEVRFVVRYIFLDFEKEAQKSIIQLAYQYDVSADFIAIAIKNSTSDEFTNSTYDRIIELFEENKNDAYAQVIKIYAKHFKNQQKQVRKIKNDYKENPYHEFPLIVADLEKEDDIKSDCHSDIDNKKVCYVLCGNDDRYIREVVLYLNRQCLPNEYKAEICVVKNAKSMAHGYNFAMERTSAKYKIYIHQDTFIFDRTFTMKIINELEKNYYQLLGVAGCENLPETGRWGESREDKYFELFQDYILYVKDSYVHGGIWDSGVVKVKEVQVLDGVLMATSEDLKWRDDIFTHFHYYDISQSMEFQRAGYHVGVLCMWQPGVLHEVSVGLNEQAKVEYEKARQIFLNEYF